MNLGVAVGNLGFSIGRLIEPEAHAAAILGILSTGANTAGVKGYFRRAEESALSVARSSSKFRGDLAEAIWRLMLDAAVQASNGEV